MGIHPELKKFLDRLKKSTSKAGEEYHQQHERARKNYEHETRRKNKGGGR